VARDRQSGEAPPPPITDPAQLREYAEEHVAYELGMFLGAALSPPDLGIADAALSAFCSNARAEALALHVRNLIAFFYPDCVLRKATDVFAHHFLSRADAYGEWIKQRGSMPSTLKVAKQRADAEVAHLTTGRIAGNPETKRWMIAPLVQEISLVAGCWLVASDPNRIGDKVRVACEDLRRVAQAIP
jgi:hypothetical protein